MKGNRSLDLKKRVAREAAILLYTLQEKEYKQAKTKAAQTLAARGLPSNLEVAKELDKIAEEREGRSRQERLLQMRREALQVMELLKKFNPKLTGSVWRGTARKDSDIDIVTFASAPKNVLAQLQKSNFNIAKTEWLSVTKRGRKEASFHIHLTLSSSNEVEVVVRSPERIDIKERCEIYGDSVTGLSYLQLERVLEENPLQKFVPK
ncbi:MAG: nucleotidyltransferase domain-containing protein [Candidatus Bathyarchaeota archaeon]|nr:MAG: nucleotidyltransferase domain-containing protein [Candidatus Bathyarchaeota archaeon]